MSLPESLRAGPGAARHGCARNPALAVSSHGARARARSRSDAPKGLLGHTPRNGSGEVAQRDLPAGQRHRSKCRLRTETRRKEPLPQRAAAPHARLRPAAPRGRCRPATAREGQRRPRAARAPPPSPPRPGAARCRHGRRRRAAPLSLSLSPRRHRGRGAPRSPTDGPPAPPRGRARSLPPSRRGALPASTGPAENGSRRRPGSEPQPPAGSRVRNGARRGDPPSGSVPPAVPTL